MDHEAFTAAVEEQAIAEQSSRSDYDELLSLGEDVSKEEATGGEKKPDPETAEGEKDKDKPEEKESQKKEEKPQKTNALKAKVGDKTIEIPEGATITKLVDGKEVEISLAEAIRHHQFNVPYARKMEEAAQAQKEAKAAKAEVEQLRTVVQREAQNIIAGLTDAKKSVEANDVDSWLKKTAATQQVPVAALAQKLREFFLPQIQKYLLADESQRNALDLEEQNRYIGSELEELRAKESQQQRLGQFKQMAVQMQQQNGLSDEDCQRADQALRAEYGNIPPVDKMSPQQFQQYIEAISIRAVTSRTESGISGLIQSVAPELKEEDPEGFQGIAESLRGVYGKYDDDDLKEVIRQALGVKIKSKKEDEAVILDDQPEKARHKPANSRNDEDDDEDDEFAEMRKQWEEDPLSVYR